MSSVGQTTTAIPTKPLFAAASASRAVTTPLNQLTTQADAIRFAGRNSFIVPDHENVLFVPGMGAPKKSITPLAEYFDSFALPGLSRVVKVPGIGRAQEMRKSVDYLVARIQEQRVSQAQTKLNALYTGIRKATPTYHAQIEAVRGFLGLDNSPQASRLAEAVHKLMTQSKIPGQIVQADPEKTGTSGPLLEKAYAYLMEQIPFHFDKTSPLSLSEQLDLYEKPLVQAFDKIAPRVTIVGHSLGGVIGLKTLLENYRNDINMVVSLGSPIAGTQPVPDAVRRIVLDPLLPPLRSYAQKAIMPVVDMIFPAIPQLRKGSKSIEKLQTTPQPVDTTVISVANPKDGLVAIEDTLLNPAMPGRINMTVSPLPAKSIIGLVDNLTAWVSDNTPFVRIAHSLARFTPFVGKFVDGIRHHCGLVENWSTYWSDQGEMSRRLFDGADSAEQLRRLLHPQNYEGVRTEVLEKMLAKLSSPQAKLYQAKYRPLQQDLAAIAAQPMPFINSSDKLAKRVLAKLNPVQPPPAS